MVSLWHYNDNLKVLDSAITFKYNIDRIFFIGWANGSYILLHQFIKKTQKTPAREIEKAKKELADIIERSVKYE